MFLRTLSGGLAVMLASSVAVAAAPDAAAGKKVFEANCAACHQPTGTGLPGAFPPLAKSDYLNGQPVDSIINVVLKGLNKPITVNGVKYSTAMPPLVGLSDADVANVLTYVYGSWGNSGKK